VPADRFRFLRLLASAESGVLADVPALRDLVAESDAVCALLEESQSLAVRFDRVVALWKASR
jgi:hypothetical protein